MSINCPCIGWCVTYEPKPGEEHHRDCKHWHKKFDAEVFQTRSEFIVTGDPSGDEEHNCDAMGCSSVSHVLFRFPRSVPLGVPTWQQRAAERVAFARGVSGMRDTAVTVIRARHESGYACEPWTLVEAIRAAKGPTDPCGVEGRKP